MCSVTPVLELSDGYFRWYITTKNTLGVGGNSTKDFKVATVTVTDAPVQIAPIVTSATTLPEYQWEAVSGALSYRLTVYDRSSGFVKVLDKVYTKEAVGCAAGGTCSVTPTTALSSGKRYQWYITGRNAGYVGPSSNTFFNVQ